MGNSKSSETPVPADPFLFVGFAWEKWGAIATAVGGPLFAIKMAVRYNRMIQWCIMTCMQEHLRECKNQTTIKCGPTFLRFKVTGVAKVLAVLGSPIYFMTWRILARHGSDKTAKGRK